MNNLQFQKSVPLSEFNDPRRKELMLNAVLKTMSDDLLVLEKKFSGFSGRILTIKHHRMHLHRNDSTVYCSLANFAMFSNWPIYCWGNTCTRWSIEVFILLNHVEILKDLFWDFQWDIAISSNFPFCLFSLSSISKLH